MKTTEFKKCCASKIKSIWDKSISPMSVVRYEGKCDVCGHYIGLTETPVIEAKRFLEKFGLSLQNEE